MSAVEIFLMFALLVATITILIMDRQLAAQEKYLEELADLIERISKHDSH